MRGKGRDAPKPVIPRLGKWAPRFDPMQLLVADNRDGEKCLTAEIDGRPQTGRLSGKQ